MVLSLIAGLGVGERSQALAYLVRLARVALQRDQDRSYLKRPLDVFICMHRRVLLSRSLDFFADFKRRLLTALLDVVRCDGVSF